MNRNAIGTLIRLRYKLLWANTRSRNGKIALFFTGYLLFVLVLVLFTAGGLGAGMMAVRSGKAETVARVVLTALFVQSLLTSVILGFGLAAVFSDLELRRFPVNARERFVARQLIGIIDPFWFLVLGLELGLAVGLYVLGAAGFWAAFAAVLLVFVANFLTAHVLAAVVGRMMLRKSGGIILMSLIMLLSFGAGILGSVIKSHPGFLDATMLVMRYTPPFGAAAAMTRSGTAALAGYGVVLAWLAILAGMLVWLERLPAVRQREADAKVTWESPIERVTASLGVQNAPLVAYWLRFYTRNSRFRTFYILALPLLGFLTFNFGEKKNGSGLFSAALGTFAIVSFMATSRFSVNQFGYSAGAFRRYFLLPVEPAAVLEAASRACLLLGAPLIPLAVLGWALFAPGPFDARMLFMLLGSGVAGLFFLHGLGLWATIYGPRKANYNQTLGNDLSLVGNIVVIGSVVVALFAPLVLAKKAPWSVDPGHWWISIGIMAAAWTFYTVSLRMTGRLLTERREQLMAVVEGRG